LFLAACNAASFTKFDMSAPTNHTVLIANESINFSWSKSLSSFLFFKYTLNISFLSSRVGLFTNIFLSNLPGLNKAGSKTSILFVAAITIIL